MLITFKIQIWYLTSYSSIPTLRNSAIILYYPTFKNHLIILPYQFTSLLRKNSFKKKVITMKKKEFVNKLKNRVENISIANVYNCEILKIIMEKIISIVKEL